VVSSHDVSIGNGHFEIVVAVVGLELNVIDRDAVVSVALVFDIINVLLRYPGVVHGNSQGLLLSDLAGGGPAIRDRGYGRLALTGGDLRSGGGRKLLVTGGDCPAEDGALLITAAGQADQQKSRCQSQRKDPFHIAAPLCT